jgi:antitoxin (DNA-binding transcriptional repressor) of toxin-antitoxin stability system
LYVHLAEAGETVVVTDRDRVVAELVPLRLTAVPPENQAPLSKAVRKGWIKPAASEVGTPPRIPVASLGDLLKSWTGIVATVESRFQLAEL